MIRSGFTCRHIMVQSVYILNILTGQYLSLLSQFVYLFVVTTLFHVSLKIKINSNTLCL